MLDQSMTINTNTAQLTVISVLLLIADLVLAVAIARSFGFVAMIKKLKDKVIKWKTAKGHTIYGYGYGSGTYCRGRCNRAGSGTEFAGTSGQDPYKEMSLFDRIGLLYIEKSNIRHYVPFMNIYILILTVMLIFVIAFRYVYGLLGFLPSAAVISVVFSLAPVFALEFLSRYNSETIRRRLSEYISVLSRWCAVKEDIIYAFEKSLSSNIGEPLQTFIRDMVIQVNRGMDPCEAMDILQMKVDDPQFRDFVVNIKLSLRHRGDIIKLLTNLENQFYKIDEEYNRRKISTYKDRVLIYFIMLAVLGTAYLFITMSPQVGNFYLETIDGKVLLMVFSCMYAFGFYMTAGITRFRDRG